MILPLGTFSGGMEAMLGMPWAQYTAQSNLPEQARTGQHRTQSPSHSLWPLHSKDAETHQSLSWMTAKESGSFLSVPAAPLDPKCAYKTI